MRNVSMSADEVNQFLTEHSTLRLATISENGWPHVVPVAYARLGDPETLYILTHPDQRKSQNIFHENRVGAVVDDGETYTELRGVFVHGTATVVVETSKMERLEQAWIDQAYGGELPPVVKTVYARREGWIWFEIDPVHRVSWDNTKLDPDRLGDLESTPKSPIEYRVPEDCGAATPDQKQ